ncbi:MAG: CRISPR-associated endonuclease Cas2 [Thermoprotei archaeon]|nr:MAG: CRISPR-associated endonuclease Cas2 [Thermoprotei archaeon]
MKTLVVYDISDDNLRLKVAETCKNHGLSRIQRSAFIGEIPSGRRKELVVALERLLRRRGPRDRVHVFVLCSSCYSMTRVIGSSVREERGEVVFV